MKLCKNCMREKPLSDFYKQKVKTKNKGEYLIYQTYCKECSKERAKEWAKRNPERRKQIKERFERTNKEKIKKYNRWYHREKRKGVERNA